MLCQALGMCVIIYNMCLSGCICIVGNYVFNYVLLCLCMCVLYVHYVNKCTCIGNCVIFSVRLWVFVWIYKWLCLSGCIWMFWVIGNYVLLRLCNRMCMLYAYYANMCICNFVIFSVWHWVCVWIYEWLCLIGRFIYLNVLLVCVYDCLCKLWGSADVSLWGELWGCLESLSSHIYISHDCDFKVWVCDVVFLWLWLLYVYSVRVWRSVYAICNSHMLCMSD